MGTGGGARPRHAQKCGSTALGAPDFVIISYFRTPLFGRPVRQYNRQTHDATTKEAESYVEFPGGLYNEQNTCLTYHLAARPWRETCQIVPSLAYRTICIVLLSQQPFKINNA